MNRHDDLDRMLSAWLDDPLVSPAPRYLEDILEQTRRTRQRPAWASLERWLPMTITLRSPYLPLPASRIALGLALLLALVLTLSSVPFLAGALLSPSPEGATANGLIAFDRDGDIYVVDPPDGEPRLLVGGPTEDIAPLWSPDGERLLFIRIDGAQETLMVTNASGTTPTVITEEPLSETSRFVWSPDSTAVTVASAVDSVPAISTFPVDGSGEVTVDSLRPRLRADMPSWRSADNAGSSDALLYRSLETTPFRLLLANEEEQGDGQVMMQTTDIEGGRNERNGWQYDFLDPVWSPDGTRFAYHTLQDLASVPYDPGFRVHIARPGDAGVPASDSILEFDAESNDEFGVSWSPDGSRVAFQALACPSGNPQACESARLIIETLSSEDGGATATVVTDPLPAPEWYSLSYAWAPDGSSLAVVNVGTADREAYLVDAHTGALEPLGWSADGEPSWQSART